MIITGVAFGLSKSFLLLVIIGIITTMNPSAGDVSPFLPLEQSLLADNVSPTERTSLFARYSLTASLVGSIGALCAGLPVVVARQLDYPDQTGRQAAFIIYGLAGFILYFAYSQLSEKSRIRATKSDSALSPASRRIVFTLSAWFSLDSRGGGLATQAIFAWWWFK